MRTSEGQLVLDALEGRLKWFGQRSTRMLRLELSGRRPLVQQERSKRGTWKYLVWEENNTIRRVRWGQMNGSGDPWKGKAIRKRRLSVGLTIILANITPNLKYNFYHEITTQQYTHLQLIHTLCSFYNMTALSWRNTSLTPKTLWKLYSILSNNFRALLWHFLYLTA